MTETAAPEREPHAAEIAKWEAEAEKARAEGEAARIHAAAEAEKLKAEARLAEVEAQTQEANLVKVRNDADREDEKRKRELADPHHFHTYNFHGGVDSGAVQKCIDQLNYWRRTDPRDEDGTPPPIELSIFSPGGSVFHGLALWDHIQVMRAEGYHFTTVCVGMAASMGGILLQAGDKRVMAKESVVLIHEVSSQAVGKLSEIEDEAGLLKMVQKRVYKIFAERSKMSAVAIERKVKRTDWWLDSDQCLKFGFIDEVR